MSDNKKKYTCKTNNNVSLTSSRCFCKMAHGHFVKTKDGYQYILLLIDSFSHWCECVPLTSQDAMSVARVLYNEIFTRFGMPASILSDRGQNVMSKLVSALCDIFLVTK